jgi:hypothetical protein
MEDLLFVAKGYIPISIVKNQWLRCLVMDQNSWVVFAIRNKWFDMPSFHWWSKPWNNM